jgi:hypothetical protein
MKHLSNNHLSTVMTEPIAKIECFIEEVREHKQDTAQDLLKILKHLKKLYTKIKQTPNSQWITK